MQNYRISKEATESNENSSDKSNINSKNNKFTGFIDKNINEDPNSRNNSDFIVENNKFSFSLYSENSNAKINTLDNLNNDFLLFNNSYDKDISDESLYDPNRDFDMRTKPKDNKNNEDNNFTFRCKIESDFYEKSLSKSCSYNYFDLEKREKNVLHMIQEEIKSDTHERYNLDINLIDDKTTSEDMQIHNIIFSERNDKKKLNEESNFFKNDFFFSKDASFKELDENLRDVVYKELQVSNKRESEKNFGFSEAKRNLKSKRKDKLLKTKDCNIKDLDKIYSLINGLFLSEISSYDKFILIYKIGNILKQDNNIYKILILEILEKYQDRKKNAVNSFNKENLNREFNHFKEEIAVLHENYSDAKLKASAEELIRRKQKFIARTLKYFTKYLKRNNFIIVKISDQ